MCAIFLWKRSASINVDLLMTPFQFLYFIGKFLQQFSTVIIYIPSEFHEKFFISLAFSEETWKLQLSRA